MSSKEWNKYRLGDIVNIKHGFAFKGEFFSDIPTDDILLTPGNIKIGGGFKGEKFKYYNGEYPEEYVLKANDIIVTMTDLSKEGDTLGYSALVPESTSKRFLHNQRLGLLQFKRHDFDKHFIYWLLRTKPYQTFIVNSASGSTVKHTSPSRIQEYEFKAPDIFAQRRIAEILSSLDEKIELNNQTNVTLEAMIRGMFRSWFIDFDPVYAKVNGQLLASLRSEIAELFPNEFQSTEIGDIPLTWKVQTVEDVAERVAMGPFGSSIKVETFVEEGIPIVSGQHLRGFILTDTSYNFISLEHAEKLKKANVYRGDVIFTHAGNIENLAFVPEDSQYSRYVVSQRQFFMRCNLEKITPTFITFYFQSPEGQHKLLANKSPVGVPSIAQPVSYLRSIKLPIPPKPILDAFERITSPLLQKYQANVHESQTLTSLRDALLPKLMRGEVEV